VAEGDQITTHRRIGIPATTYESRALRCDIVDTDLVSSGAELSENDLLSVSVRQPNETVARYDVVGVCREVKVVN
jgi:hypothetical protein